MTARKHVSARRLAPPGYYLFQDAADVFGIGPTTMTKWVAAGYVHVSRPDGTRPLVSADEVQRVLRALWDQKN